MHASLCNQYDQTKGAVSDAAPVNSKRETQLRGPGETRLTLTYLITSVRTNLDVKVMS
jgi:hypothetical protein